MKLKWVVLRVTTTHDAYAESRALSPESKARAGHNDSGLRAQGSGLPEGPRKDLKHGTERNMAAVGGKRPGWADTCACGRPASARGAGLHDRGEPASGHGLLPDRKGAESAGHRPATRAG